MILGEISPSISLASFFEALKGLSFTFSYWAYFVTFLCLVLLTIYAWFNWKLKWPFKFQFNFNSPFQGSSKRLYRVWKQFLNQIPPALRTTIQASEHLFIVLGDVNSGKTQFIRKFAEKEQEVSFFETEYTSEHDIQFYAGSNYIIQEIAWSLVEDRSIKARKELIQLWKNVCLYRDPTVVIAYNPFIWGKLDVEKIDQHVRLLANKIALLSEIVKKPIKVSIALTHVDHINGYVEFFRCLQQYGISLELSIPSYFKGKSLKEFIQSYEQYLSLILTTATADDYLKTLDFFKKIPSIFSPIEQLLRALAQKDSEKKSLVLDTLFFTSNHSAYLTAYPFTSKPTTSSFFPRRPLLSHQIACACLIGCCSIYLIGKYVTEKQQFKKMELAVTNLERYQSLESVKDTLPSLQSLSHRQKYDRSLLFLPSFFNQSYIALTNHFVNYSQDYILAPALRKTLLEKESEIKALHLLALICSSKNNRLGRLILENSKEWAATLKLPENFLITHIQLSAQPKVNSFYLENFYDLYPSSPLTDSKPWFSFFEHVEQMVEKPQLIGLSFDDLQLEAKKLVSALDKLKQSDLTAFICKLLMEEGSPEMQRAFAKKIQTLQWLKENYETLEDFLKLVAKTSLEAPPLAHMNLASFLATLKDDLAVPEIENHSYHFLLMNKLFLFESSTWHNLMAVHKVKQAIPDYIAQNRDSDGKIFFKNTMNFFDIDLSYLEESIEGFKGAKTIPGVYTQAAYEKNVYPIVDKVAKITESPLIDFELKNQFNKFIAQEVDSYAKQYKKHYQDIFHIFEGHHKTLEQAKNILSRMVEPLSHFSHFLHSLKRNLRLPTSDSMFLHSMKHLSEFQFLDTLLCEEEDSPAELSNYQNLLTQLLEELEVEKNSFVESSEQTNLLEAYLTPAAKVSLDILTQQGSSYIAQASQWLNKIAIPLKYHDFFLNPILMVHEIGLRDLKQAVEQAWSENCQNLIETLFSKFPFDVNSAELATLEEVERTLHPFQEFWLMAQQLMGPLSIKKNGNWEPLDFSALHVNEQIYVALNQISKLTNTLWDGEGNPQAIELKVKTTPFKDLSASNKCMILAYLISGDEALFNINQRPHWETFKVAWWNAESSHIGAELLDAETKIKTYRTVKVENSIWSFFQLLHQAKQENALVWTWNLAADQNEEKQEVSLCFQENPLEIFNIQ